MFIFLQTLATEEDKVKFEKLYRKYKHSMYRIAWEILHNEKDAEDIVHESFWAIIENFEKVNDISNQKTWNYIAAIVRNKSINVYNARKSHGNVSYEEEMKEKCRDTTLEEVMKKEKLQLLADVISQLSYPYKDVVYLQYYNDLSGEEIAKIIGKSPENVRKIAQRARGMMRECLLKGESEMPIDVLTEEMIKEAVKIAVEKDYEREVVHIAKENKHTFSEEFAKKMEELLNEYTPNLKRRRKKKMAIKYLLVAILILLMSGMTVLAIPGVRENCKI